MYFANRSIPAYSKKRLQGINVGDYVLLSEDPVSSKTKNQSRQEKEHAEFKIQDIHEFCSFNIFIKFAAISSF